jgi:hypothetical protein
MIIYFHDIGIFCDVKKSYLFLILFTDSRCKKNSLYCREGDYECIRQPQTISNNYMTFVSNMAIPPIGYLDLFTMRGPHWQSTGVRFNLELESARAPGNIPKVTKDFFKIRRKDHNQVGNALIFFIFIYILCIFFIRRSYQ